MTWHARSSFRCPNTCLRVQGWVADDPAAHPEKNVERYEPVTWLACTLIHLVSPKTGEVIGMIGQGRPLARGGEDAASGVEFADRDTRIAA